MTISVFDMFKVGIGPSSSQTVGPMRAASLFVSRLANSGRLDRTASVQAHGLCPWSPSLLVSVIQPEMADGGRRAEPKRPRAAARPGTTWVQPVLRTVAHTSQPRHTRPDMGAGSLRCVRARERKAAVGQPHDSLCRFVFGKPVHAASELRAVLPAPLVARLDLASLHPVNGSFVDEELNNRHADVLMRTRLDGREAFVYVLIEHQSTPDPIMPLRMLRYLLRIWDRYLQENPKAKRLPMIVPLVVYRGSRRWTYPVELSELLDVDPETARLADSFLPRFRFLLDDLTQLDKTALRARPVTTPVRLTVRLLRIVPAHPGDAVAAIDPDDIDDLRDVLRYPSSPMVEPID